MLHSGCRIDRFPNIVSYRIPVFRIKIQFNLVVSRCNPFDFPSSTRFALLNIHDLIPRSSTSTTSSTFSKNHEEPIATETCEKTKITRNFYLHDFSSYSSDFGKSRYKLIMKEHPTGQTTGLRSRIFWYVKNSLLPEGFPTTVTEDYKGFYLWSVVSGICGAASYVISTKALLSSVGMATLPAISG